MKLLWAVYKTETTSIVDIAGFNVHISLLFTSPSLCNGWALSVKLPLHMTSDQVFFWCYVCNIIIVLQN